MRLTLRTLLAWLDDTLSAADVKQIGKQVSDTPYAQELVDRTYRVTRQRRLLVPSSSGPDGTDPNTVAAYLDNELPADEVAEFEKKCLTSDVNLAEVASVHQILSLIGHKAKVPPEARHRMYRLIKGRESVKKPSSEPFHAPAPEPKPDVVPPVEWTSIAPAKRPIGERVGIAALVLGLLGVIGWTAFSSLTPDSSSQEELAANAPPIFRASGKQLMAEMVTKAATPPVEVAVPAVVEPTSVAKTEMKAAPVPEATAKAETEAKAAEVAANSAKPGTISVVKGESPVYAWNASKSQWARLNEAEPVKDGMKLLNLDPFWTNLSSGPIQASLIGGTRVGVNAGPQFTMTFDEGKALLKGADGDHPYVIKLGNTRVTITPAPGVLVGVERTWSLTPGLAEPVAAPLMVYISSGDATVDTGGNKESVKGPVAITVTPGGAIRVLGNPKLPGWVGENGSFPSEQQLAGRFFKLFRPGGLLLRDLVEAVDSDDQDIRLLAVRGLGAVGDAEMIVPVLNNASTDAGTRAAAADVLRALLAKGADNAKAVRTELLNVFGKEWADDVEKLLIGFTPEETLKEATGAELVRLLSSPELGTRELAITALKAITRRDSLEYDPTKPEGKGVKAWQDLLHKKELIKGLPPAPVAPK